MGALTTALLAPIRHWREAIKCFGLCLILAGGTLVALSPPMGALRDTATEAVSRFAGHSLLLAIPAAAIGFAAATLLLIISGSAFVSWHRFLIHGKKPRWLAVASIPRSLLYALIAIGMVFAALVPFVVIALMFTFSFVAFSGEQRADHIIDVLAAWFVSWAGSGNSGDGNSINVLFHGRLLGLPYVAFDDLRLDAATAGVAVIANLLAYGLAGAFLHAGGMLLVRVAAGRAAPRRPPWFVVGMTWNFLAYAIAWLLALIAVDVSMAAITWEGRLTLLAPLAYVTSLLTALFTFSFLAAANSYLYAGDPRRYAGFYGLD